ncbi:MAG: transketolase [Dehalococcoidia bacterium]|nr:transketolase [Dehalococcoidia bacterium]
MAVVPRKMQNTRTISQSTASTALKAPQAVFSPNGSLPTTRSEYQQLRRTARMLRRDILLAITEAGSGHPGGSLSELEILTTLYYCVLRHDPQNPSWPDRDRFILSKGHACPGLYAVLAHRGYFPLKDLSTFRKLGSHLQGHAHIGTPGVEMSSGSLGQGLSFAIGVALAGRVDGRSYRTYALLGDGECDEGQVWEAAMSAAHYKVDTLTAIVDRNGIQNDRFTHEVMELEPLADKWRAFGWRVLQPNGHSFPALLRAFHQAGETKGKPTVIIARTVKGKGVSFMENNPAFHGKAPTWEQLAQALQELGCSSAEVSDSMTAIGFPSEKVAQVAGNVNKLALANAGRTS